MNQQYREGFETNSSSSHSIYIGTGALEALYPSEDGVLRLDKRFFRGVTTKFGWEEETFDDVPTRIAYALQQLLSSVIQNYDEQVKAFSGFNVPPLTRSRFQMFLDVVMAHSGASRIEIGMTDDYDYIDHKNVPKMDSAVALFGASLTCPPERSVYGYIDHQSGARESDLADRIFESKDSLRWFLFAEDSSVTTDNDNH